MADTVISVLLKMVDNLTPGVKKAVDSVDSFSKSSEKGKQALQGVGVASGAVAVGIAGAMATVAKASIDAESSFLELEKQLGVSKSEFAKLQTEVSSMGASMGLSVKESANLGAEVAKAGLSGEKLNKTFKDIQESSVALSIDTEKMTEKYLEMNASFGDNTKKMMADINVLADNSATGAQQIIDAFSGLSPIVKQFGLDTKVVLSEMTVALEKGFDPSRVQNAYKDLILTLSRGYGELPEKANEALDEIYDGNASKLNEIWNTQGAQAAINDFKARLATIDDDAAKINLIQTIFGTNYASEMSAILNDTAAVQKFTKAIADDGKNAALFGKEFERQSNTTAQQYKVLSANIDMVKVSLGQAILPALNSIMQAVTPVVKSFAEWAAKNPELVTMGVTIAGIVGAVAAVLSVISFIASGIGAITAIVGGIGSAVMGVAGAVGIVGAGAASLALAPALIVAAVVAAVAAIVYLVVTNWETIKNAIFTGIDELGRFIGDFLDAVTQWAHEIFQEVNLLIKTFFDGVNTIVKTGVDAIVAGFKTIFTGVQTIVTELFTTITTVFQTGFDAIKTVIQGFFDMVKTIFEGGFNVIKTVVEMGLGMVKSVVDTFINTVGDILKKLATMGYESGSSMMREMARGINDNSHLVSQAMANATNDADQYIPHSPAKKGAFSTLDQAGFNIMNTIAQGMNGFNLGDMMGSAMNTAMGAPIPALSGVGGANSANITINYAPVINGGSDVMAELRKNQTEVANLVSKALQRDNRRVY